MIVAITAVGPGTGIGIPEEFRNAASTAAAVTAFVNEYTPPLNPADYIGFDTGWVGSVPLTSPGNQWGYDRDTPGMVEVALPLIVEPGNPGWNLRVEDRNLNVPPGSPAVGLFWIVAAGGTGAWAGCDDCITMWNGTSWQFQQPTPGLAAWVIDEDIVVVYVDGTTKWASYGSPIGTPQFGGALHLAESTAVSTTTSETWQNKITMITATLEAGMYRLEVSYGWNYDLNSADFWGRVTQDGTPLGEPHVQEPKDAAGTFGSTGTNQRHYLTRVFHLNLAAQSYTFRLEWVNELAGNEASIWDAYMSLWRMS